MRLHRTPGFIAVVGAVLLLLVAALIWWPDTGYAQSSSCSSWNEHDHDGRGCHSKAICHQPHCTSAPPNEDPVPEDAPVCLSPFHSHGTTCHKHCRNAGQDHGDDCTVPTPAPTRRRPRSVTPTATPTPVLRAALQQRSQARTVGTATPMPCPAAVTGFAIDSVSDSSITMTWDAPQDSQPYQYRIEACNTAGVGCPGARVEATPARSATSHTVTSLAANTPYHFRITALADPNSACSNSAASSIVTGRTAKIRLVVDNFHASEVTSTSVKLQWNAPASTTGLDEYKIEECSSADASCPQPLAVATPAKTKTSHTVTGLEPMLTYYYRITALAVPNSNYLDSDPSASRGTTSGGTPAGIVEVSTLFPPVVSLAAVCTADSAELTWSLQVSRSSISQFVVEVLEDCTDCTASVFSVPRTATSYTATGLSPNSVYQFTVHYRSIRSIGDNYASEPVSVQCTTAKKPLSAVTGFTVSNFGVDGGVPLAWNAMTHTALDKYQLQICANKQCSGSTTTHETTNTTYSHNCARGSTCYYRIRAKATTEGDYLNSPWSDFVIVSIPN